MFTNTVPNRRVKVLKEIQETNQEPKSLNDLLNIHAYFIFVIKSF